MPAPLSAQGHDVLRRVVWEDRAFDWALDFDAQMERLIVAGNHRALLQYQSLGPAARLAVPTSEHFLPLLYVLGLQEEGDGIEFFVEKVTLGSISMRSVKLGS